MRRPVPIPRPRTEEFKPGHVVLDFQEWSRPALCGTTQLPFSSIYGIETAARSFWREPRLLLALKY